MQQTKVAIIVIWWNGLVDADSVGSSITSVVPGRFGILHLTAWPDNASPVGTFHSVVSTATIPVDLVGNMGKIGVWQKSRLSPFMVS